MVAVRTGYRFKGVRRFAAAASTVDYTASWWVSTSGQDTNAGTSSLAPFRTLTRAWSTVSAGDTIMVRGGTYNEKVLCTRAGSSSARIVCRNYPGETAIIDGSGIVLGNFDALVQLNSSHITLDGLTVRNSQNVGVAFFGSGAEKYALNLTVHDNSQDTNLSGQEGGIYINDGGGAKRHIIRNCEVYNTLQGGIVVWQCTSGYVLVEDNTVHDFQGINNFDGIQVMDTPYAVVRNNTIYNNLGTVGDYLDIGGNISTNVVTHQVIDNNLVYVGSNGQPVQGIKINNDPQRSIVRRLRAYGEGFDFYSPNMEVYLYHNSIYPSTIGAHCLLLSKDGWASTEVWKRLVWRNNAFINSSAHMILELNATPAVEEKWPTFQFTNNCYKFGGNGIALADNGASTLYAPSSAGLASWISSHAQEPSTAGTFVYTEAADTAIWTDPKNLDFTVPAGSPLKNAGAYLTKTVNAGTVQSSVGVADSKFFFDGHGWLTGDAIIVGNSTCTITSIDDTSGILTVTPAITWSSGAEVFLKALSSSPNIGAL